jgi:FkbM family methyltransferase
VSVASRLRRWGRALGVDVAPVRQQATLSTHLLRVFERLAIDAVLDVGAHRGEYASSLRRIGYRGAIVSFEPIQEVHAALARAAEGDDRWATHRLALSDRDGTATLHVASGTGFSSFHAFSEAAGRLYPDLSVARTEEVPVRRLDGFLAEATAHLRDPRLFLKMDTQGHDLAVLEGARGALGSVLALQSEASVEPLYEGVPALPDFLARLRDLGFRPSGFFPVARDADDLRLVEVDVVAVRGG